MRGVALACGVAFAVLVLGACDDSKANLGAGEACTHTEQCADGLACVAGACSNDLTDLVSGGMVPVRPPDGGPDGALPDGGGDGGLPDGDVPVPDGAVPDAEVPVPDAEVPVPDASLPDAG